MQGWVGGEVDAGSVPRVSEKTEIFNTTTRKGRRRGKEGCEGRGGDMGGGLNGNENGRGSGRDGGSRDVRGSEGEGERDIQ